MEVNIQVCCTAESLYEDNQSRIATIGREQMSTTAGQTNEGPLYIGKNLIHPGLVRLSILAEDAGSLRFLKPALPKEPGFEGPTSPKGKIEHKFRRRLTKKWGYEG